MYTYKGERNICIKIGGSTMGMKRTLTVSAIAIFTGGLYYFLTKNQRPTATLSKNVEVVKGPELPKDFSERAFFMPHFMIKNTKITTDDTTLHVQVDYKIDDFLYHYLMDHTPHYQFRLTLPEQLKHLFEGNGTQKVLGELVYGKGEKLNYKVDFKFKKLDQTSTEALKAIEQEDHAFALEIMDEQLNQLNHFPNVEQAANMIRF